MNKSTIALYSHPKVSRIILKMAIPGFFTLLLNSSLTFINLMFMWLYMDKSTPYSNVISVALPAVWLLGAFCDFPVQGTSIRYATMIGQGKKTQANEYANVGLRVAIISSILSIAVTWFVFEPFFALNSHNNGLVTDNSVRFLHSLSIGFPFRAIGIFMAYMLRNTGKIWLCALCSVFYVLCNFMFIFLLLHYVNTPSDDFKFNLIAYGNDLAYISWALITTTFVVRYRHEKMFTILFKKIDKTIKQAKNIVKLGMGSFCMNIGVTAISFITNLAFRWLVIPDRSHRVIPVDGSNINNVKNTDYWQMVFGTILPIWILFLNPVYGISASGRLAVGFYYGQKNIQKVKDSIKWNVIFCASYLIIVEIIMIIFGSWMINLSGLTIGAQKTFENGVGTFNFPIAHRDAYYCLMLIGACYFTYAIPSTNLGMAQIRRKTWLAILSAVQRTVIVEGVIVVIFGLIAQATKNPWVFWWSYPVMDICSLALGLYVMHYLCTILWYKMDPNDKFSFKEFFVRNKKIKKTEIKKSG